MSYRKIVEFKTIRGKAGDLVAAQVQPEVLFRGDSFHAEDSFCGEGTLIRIIMVGAKPQDWFEIARLPAVDFASRYESVTRTDEDCARINEYSLSTCGLMHAIKKGRVKVDFDTCDAKLFLTVQVKFLKDCEFKAFIWGDAWSSYEEWKERK